jgi:hypothetical protein
MQTPELKDLIEKHSPVHFGFARPEWKLIRARAALADVAFDESVARRAWLELLAGNVGEGAAVVVDAERSYAVLPHGEAMANARQWTEHCVREVRRYLPGIADDGQRHLVILMFDRYDDYLSYTAFFRAKSSVLEDESDAGEPTSFASSAGMFIPDFFPHVAMPVADSSYETVLAHELTHALASHLQLPLWLDEGVAVSMESLLAGRGMNPTAEDLARMRDLFRGGWIQGFWDGTSFSDVEAQAASYDLAFMLTQALAGNFERLRRFATSPKMTWMDAGDAAFREEYGEGLEHLAARALGPGPWAPEVVLDEEHAPED